MSCVYTEQCKSCWLIAKGRQSNILIMMCASFFDGAYYVRGIYKKELVRMYFECKHRDVASKLLLATLKYVI